MLIHTHSYDKYIGFVCTKWPIWPVVWCVFVSICTLFFCLYLVGFVPFCFFLAQDFKQNHPNRSEILHKNYLRSGIWNSDGLYTYYDYYSYWVYWYVTDVIEIFLFRFGEWWDDNIWHTHGEKDIRHFMHVLQLIKGPSLRAHTQTKGDRAKFLTVAMYKVFMLSISYNFTHIQACPNFLTSQFQSKTYVFLRKQKILCLFQRWLSDMKWTTKHIVYYR